ncbi:MAG: 50S ribosome-binding GTPase [Deltaproteobacteria bacterium]|nr:50S ribosome-binding GTPase [Deltaproteobacteria bacterium]
MNARQEAQQNGFEEMWEKVQEILGEHVMPRIMVGGKTGVGKSSTLNALMGKHVYETGVLPTTRTIDESVWETRDGDIVVVEVPGLGEAKASELEDEGYKECIKNLALLKAHLFILVLKCDDRALELENTFMDKLKIEPLLSELPVIVVINQIDKITPVRDWEPDKLNLKTPKTEKEKNIRLFVDYVATLPNFQQVHDKGRIVPVCAGESYDDPLQYGIEDLKDKIYSTLPDSAKTIFARATELKKEEGDRITKRYSLACAGAVAANFTPGSDALLIAPIQVAMIIHLGKLHNIDVSTSTASGLLSSIGLTLTGRFIAQEAVSFIPGLKNIVGPPLAFGLTYTLGKVVNGLFAQGKLDATKEDIKECLDKCECEGNFV